MKTIDKIKQELKDIKIFYDSTFVPKAHKEFLLTQIKTLEWVLSDS